MIAAIEQTPKSRVKAPVLVVDDDDGILEFVSLSLEFQGYSIRTARNGAEALDVLASENPGVVLLDMRMPVMDGWAFARALRERGLDIPVIVMTAAQDARRWAEEIEADAYMEKPFDIRQLVATIEKVLH